MNATKPVDRSRTAAVPTWRPIDIVRLLPKVLLTALLILAIGDMIVGVFLRYVMVKITDYFDMDSINFFWVEEVGEFALAWLTLVGAGIGVAERTHFTLRLLTHRLPLAAQRVIHVVNHGLITGFGGLTAWYGLGLMRTNSTLTSPPLAAQRVIHVVNHGLIAGFGGLTAWYGLGLMRTNSTLTSPALEINLAWLYGSLLVGGVLIVLYGVASAFDEPVTDEFGIDIHEAAAAGDD